MPWLPVWKCRKSAPRWISALPGPWWYHNVIISMPSLSRIGSTLAYDSPTIRSISIHFDSGNHRPMSMSASSAVARLPATMLRLTHAWAKPPMSAPWTTGSLGSLSSLIPPPLRTRTRR